MSSSVVQEPVATPAESLVVPAKGSSATVMASYEWRATLLAASLMLVVTLVMTYPVCTRLTTHLAGDGGDGWMFVWNHWWMDFVVRHPGENLFFTKMLFAPGGSGLYAATITPTNCLISLPINWLAGPLVATNVHFLFSYWLAGFGSYLLARYLLGQAAPEHAGAVHRAAMVGGVAFAFCSYMTAHGLGHQNFIATGWMPLFLLETVRTLRERHWRHPVLAGVLLVMEIQADYNVGLAAMALGGLWVITEAALDGRRLLATGAHWRLVAAGAVFAALMVPFVLGAQSDATVSQLKSKASWFRSNQYGAPLAGFFTPNPLHPAWAGTYPAWKERFAQFHGNLAEGVVYLGWVMMPLALVGAWQGRRVLGVRVAVVAALAFLLLCMGPTLHFLKDPVFSRWQIDDAHVTPGMPFILLHYVPMLRQMRIPTRLIVAAMLMLAVLAAFGVLWLQQRLAKTSSGRPAPTWLSSLAAAACGLLVLADFWVAPFRTTPAPIPQVYRQLEWLPKDALVMDVPFGNQDGYGAYGICLNETMYYQVAHRRPMLGGQIARLSQETMQQYQPYPLLDELATRVRVDRDDAPCTHSHPSAAEAELEKLRIGVVVVHMPVVSAEVVETAHRHLSAGRWESDGERDIYYPRWVLAQKLASAAAGLRR